MLPRCSTTTCAVQTKTGGVRWRAFERARRDAAGRAERARPGAMDDARGFRKVPASVPDLLRASPRSSRELGWQRRKLVLGALVASIFAVALLRVGVRPTRASDRLAAEDPWDYLDDHLASDDAHAASASRASDRLLRLGRAGRAPSAPRDRPHRRATARLHVTRDPTTGDLIMNDVGVGAFAVTQPSPCKPIGTEADGEPVAAAFVDTRTRFRAGKILHQCDRVGEHPETFYRRLHAAEWGPLCYTPDFLRGLASTLSVCSQNHEDGVLLALLGFVGARNRVVVELRGGAGAENNGAYLVHNHGFRGLFFDPNIDNTRACSSHFKMRGVRSGAGDRGGAANADGVASGSAAGSGRSSDVGPDHPAARCIHAWVGMDTVGKLIRDNLDGVLGGGGGDGDGGSSTRAGSGPSRVSLRRRDEVDVLSIDMDGVDLYMLQPTLEAVNPRVLVVGYQDIIGPERSLTVPPVKSGVRYIPSRGSGFAGASLAAFVRVLARWGYHFVGCEATGYVGFFLRGDVVQEAHRAGRGSVHITTPEDSGCFDSPKTREGMAKRWPGVRDEAWVRVDDAWLEKYAPGPPWREDDGFLDAAVEL